MQSNYFSSFLKQLREDRNLKLREVADILRIKLRSYQRYEAGEREPDIDGLIALADFFNVSLDTLVGRTFPKD